jgi:hypothetical protein
LTTRPLTDGVSPNEACYGLFEGPQYSELHHENRWIQQLKVIRGDTICLWEQDLGPASLYEKVQPLLMPSAGDDTVSELQWWATKNRSDHYWYDYTRNLQSESTLMQDAAREYLQIEEIRRNRSVFGPAQTTQRNGFDTTVNAEKVKAKRRDRRGKAIHGPYFHD